MPLTAAVFGLMGELLATAIVADREPVPPGVKKTLIPQIAVGATEVQGLVALKSAAFDPENDTPETVRVAVPVLVTVRVSGRDLIPLV